MNTELEFLAVNVGSVISVEAAEGNVAVFIGGKLQIRVPLLVKELLEGQGRLLGCHISVPETSAALRTFPKWGKGDRRRNDCITVIKEIIRWWMRMIKADFAEGQNHPLFLYMLIRSIFVRRRKSALPNPHPSQPQSVCATVSLRLGHATALTAACGLSFTTVAPLRYPLTKGEGKTVDFCR